MIIHKIIREPLVQFFVLGAVLFFMFASENPVSMSSADEIVVSEARIDALRTQFEKARLRQPTDTELLAVVDNWIREEVLYREGVAMGLDQDDSVVRRRIAQKMEFMTDGMADYDLSDKALQDWLDSHPQDYLLDASYTLQQIYFDPSRHVDDLDEVLASAFESISKAEIDNLGDPISLPQRLDATSTRIIGRYFGHQFVEALDTIPMLEWVGPISSGMGVHLVFVEATNEPRLPDLNEVRKAVERDMSAALARKAREEFYQALRDRYAIRFEGDPLTDNGETLSALPQ